MRRRARYLPRHGGIHAIAAGAWGMDFDATDASRPFETVGQIAVVDISGPIMQHADWCWDNYDAILSRVSAAFASSCTSVVLRIDSPGGDALGCFETAREIRALATTSGKPLLAYADGTIASAAYALACAASAIYVPPAGFVGSIGVMRPLVDTTALDRAMGLNFVVIASGARKLDSNPHVPISDGAKAETQAQVDSLAELFFALVSEMRGVPADHVRDLEAAMFHGEKAVSAKLADGVVTFNELLAMVAGGKAKALAGSSESGMNYKELRAQQRAELAKMAEGTGDDADKAKKCLAAMDEEDKAAPPAPEKKEAKAEDAPPAEKKEAKAEDAPPAEKKKDDDDPSAKALAISLAAKVHAMEAERAKEKEDGERAKLFAERPDFSAETKATLAKAPIETLREAVAKWPRINLNPAAAATVQATRGAGDTEAARTSQLPADEKSELDARMGLGTPKEPIRREGRSVVFGAMTSEQARKLSQSTNGGGR